MERNRGWGGSASVGGRRLLRRLLADRSGLQVERWVAVASNSSAEEHEGWGSQGGLLMVAHADLISQGLSEYD